MPETLTITQAINLPDATGGDTGEGFTCTGLCNASDGGWWVGRHPFALPSDPTGLPGFVKLSEDFLTVELDVSTSEFGSSTSIQGLALDTTDNRLWIPVSSSIRHYNEDGTRITGDVVIASPAASGIAYDETNDILYVINSSGDFQTYNPNTLSKIGDLTDFPVGSPDHLTMVNGKVWCSAGANGTDGVIYEYDPVATTWTHLYTLTGADAIEGIAVRYNKLYVCNDGYYHAADGADPAKNRILIYTLPGFDPAPGPYTYPIGVPTPWVAPTATAPSRPADWSSEVPGYYCVDYVSGTNTGRTWGTPTAPRKTIPTSLGPGTRCEVLGDYTTGGSYTDIIGAGNSGAWVANTSGPAWLVGTDANNKAAFGQNIFISGSYLYLDNISNGSSYAKVQIGSTNSSSNAASDHIMVRNALLVGNPATSYTQLTVASNLVDNNNNIIVYNCDISGCGDGQIPDTVPGGDWYDPDGDCIFVTSGGATNVWILDNHLYNQAGAGIGLSAQADGTPTTSNVYLARNHIHETWGVGIGVKTADNIVISENTVHDITWTKWTAAKCIGGQYHTPNLWIIFNHCYNGDQGIKMGSTSETPNRIYVIGNVVHDIFYQAEEPEPTPEDTGYYAGITIWGGDERHIINNTVYNCHTGIGFPSMSDVDLHTGVIYNNIVGDCIYNQLAIDSAPQYAEIGPNLLYQSDGAVSIALGNSSYTVTTANALAYVDGLIEANPLFVSVGSLPSNRNLALQESSPAIDAGIAAASLPVNVYATYLAEFGVSIQRDFTGGERPYPDLGDWDIGAYEYGSSAPAPAPDAPTFSVSRHITPSSP